MCLFIIGFIEQKSSKVLINPRYCNTISEIINYITDHELDYLSPLNDENLESRLLNNELIKVDISEYKVALLLGSKVIMKNNIDRFVQTGNKRYYFLQE